MRKVLLANTSKIVISFLCLLSILIVHGDVLSQVSSYRWAAGQIDWISLGTGSDFSVKIGETMDDYCLNGYLHFSSDYIDAVELKNAYALALLSISLGKDIYVVYVPADGEGWDNEECMATSKIQMRDQ